MELIFNKLFVVFVSASNAEFAIDSWHFGSLNSSQTLL